MHAVDTKFIEKFLLNRYCGKVSEIEIPVSEEISVKFRAKLTGRAGFGCKVTSCKLYVWGFHGLALYIARTASPCPSAARALIFFLAPKIAKRVIMR